MLYELQGGCGVAVPTINRMAAWCVYGSMWCRLVVIIYLLSPLLVTDEGLLDRDCLLLLLMMMMLLVAAAVAVAAAAAAAAAAASLTWLGCCCAGP